MKTKPTYLLLALLSLLNTPLRAASPPLPSLTPDTPCDNLLALVNRPSQLDSACTVPEQKTVFEAGYRYSKLQAGGYGQDFPEAELRFGLPWQSELSIQLPDYYRLNVRPHSGFSATTVGLKHELSSTKNFLWSVEGLLTLPTGSYNFGSNGWGAALNGLIEYNFNPEFSLSLSLGLSSLTMPQGSGGGRYTSINPDVVFSWQPRETVSIYLEAYGQTTAAFGQGAGFNMDGGVLYLVRRNLSLDAEIGQRISGNLQGFSHYLGVGLALLF